MTHPCCPGCRLRFTRATASGLVACPNCGEELSTGSATQVLGFLLWDPAAQPLDALAIAMAAAALPPDPSRQ